MIIIILKYQNNPGIKILEKFKNRRHCYFLILKQPYFGHKLKSFLCVFESHHYRMYIFSLFQNNETFRYR